MSYPFANSMILLSTNGNLCIALLLLKTEEDYRYVSLMRSQRTNNLQ